jgi:Domain of unknown function (DUF4388)
MTTSTTLQGSLKDFGLVEVLQMMGLSDMTGAVHLKQASNRIGIVYFNQGKLASCSELDVGALTLGDVLQQLGMVTHEQVERAFLQQVRDVFGIRIGERLIAMGVISDKQLKEALRTKALWTVRELALWEEGSYEFIASPNGQPILPYGEEPLNLEIMRITMEMVRYSDEWQRLRMFLPQGMHTALQMVPAIPYVMSFDVRTLELLGFVRQNGVVRRIASAMQRPELEVARELAQLVQQKLLIPVYNQELMPRANDRGVRLPRPAEKLRMESFELLNLISRVEQDWTYRHTHEEQLPALVKYVNWTMDGLAEACQANGTELDQNTLEGLLSRNSLRYLGTYKFVIDQNHIDVDDFSALCLDILHGEPQKAKDFFEEASIVLQRILACILDSINGRVASLYERLENQEIWETLFKQFGLPRG